MAGKGGKFVWYDTREYGTLTNYQDKFIILSGGLCVREMMSRSVVYEVLMYDIKRNKWSHCPGRKGRFLHENTLLVENESTNHSSVCLNGKIFLFFGELCIGGFPSGERSNFFERWDVQAHLEGRPNEWEMLLLPPKLNICPMMAPISDTEIAFLTGGVAIYDVVNETVTNGPSMAGFSNCGSRNTCVTSRRG